MAIIRFKRTIKDITDSIYIDDINNTDFENCYKAFEIEFISSTVKITNKFLSVGLPNLERIIFNDGNKYVDENVFIGLKNLKSVVINCLYLYININNFIDCSYNPLYDKNIVIGYKPLEFLDIPDNSRFEKISNPINKQIKKLQKEQHLNLKIRKTFTCNNFEYDLNPIPYLDCKETRGFIPISCSDMVKLISNVCAIFGKIYVINNPDDERTDDKQIDDRFNNSRNISPRFVRINENDGSDDRFNNFNESIDERMDDESIDERMDDKSIDERMDDKSIDERMDDESIDERMDDESIDERINRRTDKSAEKKPKKYRHKN